MGRCFTSVRLNTASSHTEPLNGAAFLRASGEGGVGLVALKKQNSNPSPISKGLSYPTAASKQRAVRSESASTNVKSRCLSVSPFHPLHLTSRGRLPPHLSPHGLPSSWAAPCLPPEEVPCTVHLPQAADSILWMATAFGAATWGVQGRQAGRQAGGGAGGRRRGWF